MGLEFTRCDGRVWIVEIGVSRSDRCRVGGVSSVGVGWMESVLLGSFEVGPAMRVCASWVVGSTDED